MNIVELKEKKISELNKLARELNVEGASSMRKQDLSTLLSCRRKLRKTG